jgi:peptidoglycan hydrolase CwlO-like protein
MIYLIKLLPLIIFMLGIFATLFGVAVRVISKLLNDKWNTAIGELKALNEKMAKANEAHARMDEQVRAIKERQDEHAERLDQHELLFVKYGRALSGD